MAMKLAITPEERRQWMQQWREASIALDEIKRDELANMSDEEAWRQTEDVLSITNLWRNPDDSCGLIEQQAVFHRRRKK